MRRGGRRGEGGPCGAWRGLLSSPHPGWAPTCPRSLRAGGSKPWALLAVAGLHGRPPKGPGAALDACAHSSLSAERQSDLRPRPAVLTGRGQGLVESRAPGARVRGRGLHRPPAVRLPIVLLLRGHIPPCFSCWGAYLCPREALRLLAPVPGRGAMEADSRLTRHDRRPGDGQEELGQHVHGSKPLTDDMKVSDVQTQMQAFDPEDVDLQCSGTVFVKLRDEPGV